MAFPSTLLSLAAASASNFLNVAFGGVTGMAAGLNQIITDLLAAETKLGTGASTPTANTVLRGTGPGTSAFGQVVNADIAAAAGIPYSKLNLAAGIVSADITPGTVTRLKIGEAVGTGASGVLEVASIPGTYRALYGTLDGGRSDASGHSFTVRMTFETSPTAGAYDHQRLFVAATSLNADENIGTSDFLNVGLVPGSTSTANLTASIAFEIPGYASTTPMKIITSRNGGATNLATGEIFVIHTTGVYEVASAISRVRLTLSSGNWPATARLTIWGDPA